MRRYMLDTVIFDMLLDGKIAPEDLAARGQLVATDLQILEISKAKPESRKIDLEARFSQIGPRMESNAPVFGAMTWGRMYWPSSGAEELFNLLQSRRTRAKYRKRKRKSDQMDSLIADAAIQHGCTLLTCDSDLEAAINQLYPGTCVFIRTC